MNISIDDLLDYINDDNDTIELNNDIKILEKDKTENFSNAPDFKDIFSDFVERYGIISYDKDKNISFLYSLLYLIDDDYYLFSEKEQINYIKALKVKLISETTKKNLLKNLNLKGNGWNKKNLINLLKKDIIDFNYVYYIISYFNINLFLVDIEKKCIYSFYNDDKFILQKTNILMSLTKNIYEPLIYIDGSKQYLYNSDLIDKIIKSDKLKMPTIGFTKLIKVKDFEISNKLDTYDNNINDNNEPNVLNDINELVCIENNNLDNNNLPIYKINKDDIELELNTVSEDYNTENNFNKYKSFSVSDMLKYKKDELINICKELNIPYSNKNKLILVKSILDK